MNALLKNLSIRKKLITSHGIIALLAVLCAVTALFGIKGLIADLTTIQEDAIGCVKAASNLMYASADIERSIFGFISDSSTEHYSRLEDAINADTNTIRAAFSTLDNSLTAFRAEEAAGPLYTQLSQLFEESEPVRSRIMAHLQNNDFDSAHALYLSDYRVSLNSIIISAGELFAPCRTERIHKQESAAGHLSAADFFYYCLCS